MRTAYIALALLLTACGEKPVSPALWPPTTPTPWSRDDIELGDLSGLSLEEFYLALVPRLASKPSHLSAYAQGRTLGQIWMIDCEKTCFIFRR